MKYFAFLFIVLQFLDIAVSDFGPKCKDPSPMNNFDQSKCMGLWYQIAGTKPCPNCCITHFLQPAPGGMMNLTETIKRPNEEKIINSVVVKQEPKAVYTFGDESNRFVVVDIDYTSYALLYMTSKNKMLAFSRNANTKLDSLLSKNGIAKCNMKLYQYNPAESCNQ